MKEHFKIIHLTIKVFDGKVELSYQDFVYSGKTYQADAMANEEILNNDDDDLITYINSFAIPPMEEEENILKRSYNSMSDVPKEKKHKVDFKIESPYLDMTSKRNMLLQMADMKKEIDELKQLLSGLKDKIDTINSMKTYRKNSVMGQLEIIKELLINMQK